MYSAQASESNILYLKEHNEYNKYFETAKTGIIYIDNAMKVRIINTEAQIICGIDTVQVINKRVEAAFKSLGDKFIRVATAEQEKIYTTSLKLKVNEQINFIQITSLNLHDCSSGMTGRILVLHDVSDVRAAIKQIQTTQLLMSLGELAAGVAHHVRTPLTTISGYLQVMLSRLEDDRYTVRKDVLEMLLDEVSYINNVVKELIMFAKPPISKESGININQLIEESLLLTFKQIGGENVQIDKSLANNLPAICADSNMMKQSLVNIMQNAMEAMPAAGILTIKSWLHAQLNMIVVSIADTGNGVAPEILPRVFEPFYTTKLERMGLGLPTAHRIVTEHGGFINISNINGETTDDESYECKGTKVNIYLPIVNEHYPRLKVVHQQILNLQ